MSRVKSALTEEAFRESFPGVLSAREKKKLRILETCIHEIAHAGAEDFNLGSLARRLKMSRSNLQYYFKDLETLLEGVMRITTATAQNLTIEAVRKDPDPDFPVYASVRGAFRWAREYPDQMACLLMFFYYTGFTPKIRQLSHEVRETGRSRLAALLESDPKRKRSRSESSELAAQIQALITGALVSQAIEAPEKAASAAEKRCLKSVRALLEMRNEN